MQNFINSGNSVEYANSGGAITSGSVVVMGNRVGVAIVDIAASTGTGDIQLAGRVNLPKHTGEAFTVGQALGWDSQNSVLKAMAAGFIFAGYAPVPALSADAVADILLAPGPNQMALQAASTASDVATLKADFNTLLTALQTAGFMKNA